MWSICIKQSQPLPSPQTHTQAATARLEALTSALPVWVQRIGERRQLERSWLTWQLQAAATARLRVKQAQSVAPAPPQACGTAVPTPAAAIVVHCAGGRQIIYAPTPSQQLQLQPQQLQLQQASEGATVVSQADKAVAGANGSTGSAPRSQRVAPHGALAPVAPPDATCCKCGHLPSMPPGLGSARAARRKAMVLPPSVAPPWRPAGTSHDAQPGNQHEPPATNEVDSPAKTAAVPIKDIGRRAARAEPGARLSLHVRTAALVQQARVVGAAPKATAAGAAPQPRRS